VEILFEKEKNHFKEMQMQANENQQMKKEEFENVVMKSLEKLEALKRELTLK
jgi:hypothetical protein